MMRRDEKSVPISEVFDKENDKPRPSRRGGGQKMSEGLGELFQRFVLQALPKAVEFVEREDIRGLIELVGRSTKSPPVVEAVEYDEETREVFVKIKLEPILGVDIRQYAEAVDYMAKLVLELLKSLFQQEKENS